MIWNASGVSNYTYHRRRFLLACLGLIAGLAVIAGAAIGISQDFSAKNFLSGFFGLALITYFGWMASREWRQARAAD